MHTVPLTRPTALRRLALGALAAVAFITGTVADIRSFDRTRGGYEPPYTGFTGTPIDWSAMETTQEGLLKRGYVIDVAVNCTSGMMHFQSLGLRVPFRPFSERAIVVHKPREACLERGFVPEF